MTIEVEGSVRLARRANEEEAEAVRGVHETAEELNSGHVVSLLRYRMRDLTPAQHQEYSSTAERLLTLVTNVRDSKTLNEALGAGAVKFLNKPVSEETFIDALNEALR